MSGPPFICCSVQDPSGNIGQSSEPESDAAVARPPNEAKNDESSISMAGCEKTAKSQRARHFVDEEALASDDSSDEDVSMFDDAYDDSFVDDAIQIDNVDMESVYLRSLLVEKKVEPPRRLPTSVFSQTPPYEVWMNRCLRSDQLR